MSFALTSNPTNYPDSAAITSLSDIDSKLTNTGSGLQVVQTTPVQSATSTVTSVASSVTNVQLLAANASRKTATFFYSGSNNLYLKLGTTASTSSYSIKIPPGGYYELPSSVTYTGEIDGIWDVATGNVLVTELS